LVTALVTSSIARFASFSCCYLIVSTSAAALSASAHNHTHAVQNTKVAHITSLVPPQNIPLL